MQKISLFYLFISSDTVNFRVPWPGWLHLFLITPSQIFFDPLLIYVNLFWRYSWLKILQPDWLRTFWPISQELNFSNYGICDSKNYRKNSARQTEGRKDGQTLFNKTLPDNTGVPKIHTISLSKYHTSENSNYINLFHTIGFFSIPLKSSEK